MNSILQLSPGFGLLLLLVTVVSLLLISLVLVPPATRRRFGDTAMAFGYRMGAGFPGDVNRTHPAQIEPCLIDPAAPPTAFGQPVLADKTTVNGVRPFTAGDQSDTVAAGYGITVRSFPSQQRSGGDSSAFGAATPPVTGIIDILRKGYIIVKLNDVAAVTHKGDPVFVWAAATSGAHVQGGVEAVFSAGNTTQLDGFTFNGPPDADGVVEIDRP